MGCGFCVSVRMRDMVVSDTEGLAALRWTRLYLLGTAFGWFLDRHIIPSLTLHSRLHDIKRVNYQSRNRAGRETGDGLDQSG